MSDKALNAYRQALDRLAAVAASHSSEPVRFRRIADDVAPYVDAHLALSEQAVALLGPWQSGSGAATDRLLRVLPLGNQMDAMLRAAIVFGDAGNSRALQAALGVSHELTVTAVSGVDEYRAWASRLDDRALTRAHALRIYRNQIILHFGAPRTAAATWHKHDFGNRRLAPIDFHGYSPERHDALEDIARRNFGSRRPANVDGVEPARQNFWELLETLFYGLSPLHPDGSRNNDRKFVDRLAVHGGIKSPTMVDVVRTLELFTLALADSLAGDR